MKISVSVFLLLSAALIAGVAVFLFTSGERAWVPPPAQPLDMQSYQAPNIDLAPLLDPGVQLVAARPLFSQSRRPEEVVVEAQVTPVTPEEIDQLVVLGLFGSGPARGGIFRDQGKVVRLLSGERIGAWLLKRVDGSEVEFVGDDGRSHVLRVKHLPQPVAAPGADAGAKQAPTRPAIPRRGDVEVPEESSVLETAPSINVQ